MTDIAPRLAPALADRYRLRASGMALALAFLSACSDVRDLATLQYALQQEFGQRAGVSLADGLVLTVTLADSTLVGAPCERQAAVALEAARFTRRYERFDSLLTVSVSMVRPRPDGSGTEPPTHLPFRFSRTALQTGQLAADSASAVALCRLEAE